MRKRSVGYLLVCCAILVSLATWPWFMAQTQRHTVAYNTAPGCWFTLPQHYVWPHVLPPASQHVVPHPALRGRADDMPGQECVTFHHRLRRVTWRDGECAVWLDAGTEPPQSGIVNGLRQRRVAGAPAASRDACFLLGHNETRVDWRYESYCVTPRRKGDPDSRERLFRPQRLPTFSWRSCDVLNGTWTTGELAYSPEYSLPQLALLHGAFGAVMLLIGMWQFNQLARDSAPDLHHIWGTVYLCCLLLSTLAVPSFLHVSVDASEMQYWAAVYAALAWWLFTATRGWIAARRRHFFLHRLWMLRNFSLTLSAVTWRGILVLTFPLAQAHQAPAAFLQHAFYWAFILTPVVAELYIYRVYMLPLIPLEQSLPLPSDKAKLD